MQDKEIEVKFQISNKKDIVQKLVHLGANFESKKKQIDILYNSKYFDFGKLDQALRLRVEKSDRKSAVLAFKGTPKITRNGHKVRDEYETKVNPKTARMILTSIGFEEVAVIEKTRLYYKLGNLEVAIDELKFGTFIEIEGAPKDIESLRQKLGLKNTKPVKRGYIFLQIEWEKSKYGVA